MPHPILKPALERDPRALGQLLSVVERGGRESQDIMSAIRKMGGSGMIVGVTGPPGAGKSTLVDALIDIIRKGQQTVGVVAIDPSSPFSGGAVLGDRVRMSRHATDTNVFIRSLGTHGAHGGLSRFAGDIARCLVAAGFDWIFVETVGVGQTELDIAALAGTTLVVLVPESGDAIQMMKAGLVEIGHVFVVNKSDREGSDRLVHALRADIELGDDTRWKPPVIATSAMSGEGVPAVLAALKAHRALH